MEIESGFMQVWIIFCKTTNCKPKIVRIFDNKKTAQSYAFELYIEVNSTSTHYYVEEHEVYD